MGKARGAAPKGREGWPGARAQRGRAGLAGRRARPAGVTGCDCGASRLQRDRRGREGAEPSGNSSMLGLAGPRPKRAKCAGRGAGARACAARGCLSPKPRRGRPPPDGPGPRPPAPSPARRCAAPAALRALRKLGIRPPTAAQARAWRARGCPGRPPPGCDSGQRTALTFPGAGRKTEASFQRLLLECAVR